jgi:hypothetical protein
MAARRLLIVMLVLLGISALAAALVPPPERQREGAGSPTSTTEERADRERPGERVEAEVSAAARRPEEVRVSQGDQLALVVETESPAEIAVPDFGLIEFAEPGAPARFDMLIDRDGRFEVTAERQGTVAAIVAVRAKRQS